MLHPKQNRIDYGNQLVPPEGYALDRAIGTTYSLDLEALMVLPVALFYAQPLDGQPSELRYDMLDAITKAAEKITVYCQKAHIKVPRKFHYLTAYWEKGIEEVQMAHHAQSFHPKIWVIRYTHPEGPPKYRLLVTSRNLTFARDWDVAFAADGTVGDEVVKQNTPLIDFLTDLEKRGKTKIPESFYTDLQRAKFDSDLGRFNKLTFHPIGVSDGRNKGYTNPVSTVKAWDEILIISPFVDNATLKKLAQLSRKRRYLLSRKEELDGIDLEFLNDYSCFQFSKLIELSEFNEDLGETDVGETVQNLHAKLFITQEGDKVFWFLGSANCTDPAQDRNVEFMVGLKGPSSSGIRVRDIFHQLTNPEKADGVALFEPYDPALRVAVAEKKNVELAIRKIKYDLSQLAFKGDAVLIENATTYELHIEVDARSFGLPTGFAVKMKPACEEQKKPFLLQAGQFNAINQYSGYAETRLSPFLEFEIWYGETRYSTFLLMMDIVLPASRLNKIFSSIIDSKEKFLKYLSFLLTGEETSLIGESGNAQSNPGKGSGNTLFDQLPIYEKLLIATSRYPDKLVAVDKLMQRLKDESTDNQESVISQEFEEFWQIFREYHQTLEHAG